MSGSMHYYRVPRPFWRQRLKTLKLAGLNTVQVLWVCSIWIKQTIGAIGWCPRGALLLTCMRNGVIVQIHVSLFLQFNMTRLRHMWSGPPMSPSPMSPCGAKAQTWGLSSSKPSRWLLEVWGSSFQVGLDVILRPGPFIDAERDFVGLPYWLLKWVRLFGLHNSSFREGEGKLRTSNTKFLARVRSWFVNLIVLKVDLSSL